MEALSELSSFSGLSPFAVVIVICVLIAIVAIYLTQPPNRQSDKNAPDVISPITITVGYILTVCIPPCGIVYCLYLLCNGRFKHALAIAAIGIASAIGWLIVLSMVILVSITS